MLFLDLKTTAVVGMILHVALALVMVQTYICRKTYPGFRSWTVGVICWVLASAAFFFRLAIGEGLSVALSNPLFFLFAMLMHDGLARFYGLENRARLLALDGAVSVAGLAVIYWNFFVVRDVNIRVTANSLVLGFILCRAALGPLLVAKARKNPAQIGISLSFVLVATLLVVRAVVASHDAQYSGINIQDPMLKAVVITGLFAMVIAVYGFISLTNARLEEELLEAQDRLREQANTDPLTGLMNRRGFTEMARHDIRLATRYGHRMSLIILDLDHFKRINDTHGHAVGDVVLAGVAQASRRVLRQVDTMARWGGEEFAVLLPETGLEDARQTAERLRELLRGLRPVPGQDIFTTASFGVAELHGDSFEELTVRADALMYRAKGEGRNRVCAEG